MDYTQQQAAIAMAADVVAKLRLINYVRKWNTGEGSLITTWDHWELAVTFEVKLLEAYDAARARAVEEGFGEDYDDALRRALMPVILSTSVDGLFTLSDRWAAGVIATPPTVDALPFDDAAEWVSWCLECLDRPPICGPYGEEILSDGGASLLTRALLARQADAAASGWLAMELS